MLALKEHVFGRNHPRVANSYDDIGCVLYRKGDYKGAREEFRKALAIRESALGKDHPDVAKSHVDIGSMFYYQGDYDVGLVEFRKALKIRSSKLGYDHPCTQNTADWINHVLEAQKNMDG